MVFTSAFWSTPYTERTLLQTRDQWHVLTLDGENSCFLHAGNNYFIQVTDLFLLKFIRGTLSI